MPAQEELFHGPAIPTHFKMWKYQWVGLPLLLMVPILALLGVFGKETESLKVSSQGLEVSIEYPSKMRYRQEGFIRLEFKNVSDQTVRELSVNFDKNYIHSFDSTDFNPQPEKNYVVNNGDLLPGETRNLDVKLQAGEYGSHSGVIRISSQNKEIMAEEISTFIFP